MPIPSVLRAADLKEALSVRGIPSFAGDAKSVAFECLRGDTGDVQDRLTHAVRGVVGSVGPEQQFHRRILMQGSTEIGALPVNVY
jgi:hypothetical protein